MNKYLLFPEPKWDFCIFYRCGSWWWTGRPGVLRFTGSQRVGHDWAAELNWTIHVEKWTKHRCSPQWVFTEKRKITSHLKRPPCASFVTIYPKGDQCPDLWSMAYFLYLWALCKRNSVVCFEVFSINLLYSTLPLLDSSLLLCMNFIVSHSVCRLQFIPFAINRQWGLFLIFVCFFFF